MERRLTEEQITKAILDWLEKQGWEIICYDFPQSGTGISLHPNEELRTTKNKGAIIPDVVAIKGTIVLFFENKDRFVLSDFVKVNDLKTSSDYSTSLQKLLKNYKVSKIFYGVGLPKNDNILNRIKEHEEKIDFAVCVEIDKAITVQWGKTSIFV
jgi:Holliday junction resolvase